MKFSVIGGGSWGTAIACSIASNQHDVALWTLDEKSAKQMSELRENVEFLPGTILPDNVEVYSDLKKALENTDIIILVVPSHAVRSVAKQISEFVKNKPVVNLAKGLEQGTLLRMSQVIKEELPECDVAVLSGPSHAEEVALGMPTTNIIAGTNDELIKTIQKALMTPAFRLYTSKDVIGVELGGSLKNVIALCAGVCDGIGFGDNTKAALMTRGIAEISRLGVAMGADWKTFGGLSGIGDLIVTCTSMHSRNRRAGILIGQGKTVKEALDEVKMVVEGVKTADAAYNLALKYNVDMPICSEAYKVLFEGKSAKDAVYDLMLREEKAE